MPVTMKDCESSHIARYGYEDGALHVEFKSGAKGSHANVTPEQFAAFEAAPSIGSAYHAMFRGRSGHPWTPAGKKDGEPHEGAQIVASGSETHPLAHIEGIDEA